MADYTMLGKTVGLFAVAGTTAKSITLDPTAAYRIRHLGVDATMTDDGNSAEAVFFDVGESSVTATLAGADFVLFDGGDGTCRSEIDLPPGQDELAYASDEAACDAYIQVMRR